MSPAENTPVCPDAGAGAGAGWALACVAVDWSGSRCPSSALLLRKSSPYKRLLLKVSEREGTGWCAIVFDSGGCDALVWLVTSRTRDVIFSSCASERAVVPIAVVEASAMSWQENKVFVLSLLSPVLSPPVLS